MILVVFAYKHELTYLSPGPLPVFEMIILCGTQDKSPVIFLQELLKNKRPY